MKLSADKSIAGEIGSPPVNFELFTTFTSSSGMHWYEEIFFSNRARVVLLKQCTFLPVLHACFTLIFSFFSGFSLSIVTITFKLSVQVDLPVYFILFIY